MTDTMGIVYHNNYSAAYYFIDDVSLVDCTGQGVQELGIKNEELGIYPNPATTELRITNDELGMKELHIFNILGCEMLKQVQYDQSITIDISGFAKGIYFVEVQTEKGVLRKRVIVQ